MNQQDYFNADQDVRDEYRYSIKTNGVFYNKNWNTPGCQICMNDDIPLNNQGICSSCVDVAKAKARKQITRRRARRGT